MPDDAIAQGRGPPEDFDARRCVFAPGGSFLFLEGFTRRSFRAFATRFVNVDAGPEDSFLAGIAPRTKKSFFAGGGSGLQQVDVGKVRRR